MTVKNIYNSTVFDALKETLKISLAVDLNYDFVNFTVDTVNSQLTLNSLEHSPDGSKGIYSSSITIPYTKVNLGNLIPDNIVFGLTYPTTFDILQNYLIQDYQLLIEENDFVLEDDISETLLKSGSVIGSIPDINKKIYLKTSKSSGRWEYGSILPITLTKADLNYTQMVITGKAPDAISGSNYNYSYSITGGTGPYTWEIVSGQSIVPLNEQGQLIGIVQSYGIKSWTLKVTDSVGFFTEMNDFANVSYSPLLLSGNPIDGLTANSYDYQFNISGGVQPYQLSIVNGFIPEGLILNNNGQLSGLPNSGIYNFTIKVTDSINHTQTLNCSLKINNRNNKDIAISLLNKMISNYSFDEENQNYLLTFSDIFGDHNLNSDAPVKNDFGFNGAAIGVDGNVILRTTIPTDQFNNNFSVVAFIKPTTFSPSSYILGQSDNLYGWSLTTDDSTGNRIRLNCSINGQIYSGLSSNTLLLGNYNFIVAQKFDNKINIFINGEKETFNIVDGDVNTNDQLLFSLGGCINNLTINKFKGFFDNVVLFNEQLYDDEINYFYNLGNGKQLFELKEQAGEIVTANAPLFINENLSFYSGLYSSFSISIISGVLPYGDLRLIVNNLPIGITVTKTTNSFIISGQSITTGSFPLCFYVKDSDGRVGFLNNILTVS